MTQRKREVLNQNRSDRKKVLVVLLILVLLAGAGYWALIKATSGINPSAALGLRLAYVAVLYMPTPLYALLISRFMLGVPIAFRDLLSFKRVTARGCTLVVGLFLAWAILMVIVVAILGWLYPELFGRLITTNKQLLHNLETVTGTSIDASAVNLPPTPLVMLPFGIFSSLMAD